jgi:hypothetical protein
MSSSWPQACPRTVSHPDPPARASQTRLPRRSVGCATPQEVQKVLAASGGVVLLICRSSLDGSSGPSPAGAGDGGEVILHKGVKENAYMHETHA